MCKTGCSQAVFLKVAGLNVKTRPSVFQIIQRQRFKYSPLLLCMLFGASHVSFVRIVGAGLINFHVHPLASRGLERKMTHPWPK